MLKEGYFPPLFIVKKASDHEEQPLESELLQSRYSFTTSSVLFNAFGKEKPFRALEIISKAS